MVVHGPYPIGQPPRVVRAIGAARDAGFEVDVIATRRPDEAAREVVGGAKVVRLPIVHRRGTGRRAMLFEYGGFTLIASALLLWRTLRRRYDIVHVHNPPDFLICSALIPRLLGSRVIFDVHDLAPDMFAMRFPAETKLATVSDRVLRLVERFAGAVGDAVVTVHQPYREELVKRGFSAAKITVVMNSVDDAAIPPETPHRASGVFRIVYHGTVTPHYGLDLLIRALPSVLAAVPTARVEVFGEGDAVPDLERLAEELGVSHAVRISNSFLPHRQVLEAIAGASVGVVANRPVGLNRFALSTKLFEYCALGIPAVVADLSTLRAHFDESEVLFFKAGDESALAEALLAVAKDRALAEQRAHAAKVRLQQYSWSVSRRRYVGLLEDLVGKPGLAGGSRALAE
jgi:glycosyltransferase involved in cell wall biosynthesis